ncbi:response regulator transcription factor [Puteibacter caeruleilacunae]|nr:response regulator transcription factor [Puteibacter caeruleilacunae]
MRILIIEDEPLAVEKLVTTIKAINPEVEITAICDTIKSAVAWIKQHPAPDLAFFDIHLGDGMSFEIFDQVDFSTPVIFTTAYNQYAIQAFKVNSIDYLLKPVGEDELRQALDKFEKQTSSNGLNVDTALIQKLTRSLGQTNYKKRFIAKVGAHLKRVEASDIVCAYSFQKGTFLKTTDGKDYLIDYSLEYLVEVLDPELFFRINRKYIIALNEIKDVITYSNSRLKLKLTQSIDEDILVAREKVKEFKRWLEGE